MVLSIELHYVGWNNSSHPSWIAYYFVMKFLYEWDEENKQPASEQLKAQTKPKKNDIIQAMVKAGIPLDVTSDSDSKKMLRWPLQQQLLKVSK